MSTAITQIQEFKNSLSKIEIASLLPTHIPEERFKQVVITAMQKSPNLLSLNRSSLFNACMECAKDGLLPDGREAALVPYKGTVRYTPMVAGITKKARNSGEIATIDAQVVYENDEYDSWIDEKGSHFKHKKSYKDRGNPILTYAYAITKDHSFYFEEIPEDQMKAIEGCSPANNSPWKGAFRDEMKRKSAIRRLCKYRLPSSTDIDNVIYRDDGMYDLEDAKPEPLPEEEKKQSRIDDVVDATFTTEQIEPEVVDIEENFVIGIVKDIKSKSGETNGRSWTKIWCVIEDIFYGTFDKKYSEIFTSSMDNNIPLKIEYKMEEKNGKTFHNIISAELIQDDLPI